MARKPKQTTPAKRGSTVGSASAGGKHKATYTRDKKTGKFLIRVVGPHANAFIGREVPVATAAGEVHTEKLLRVKFSGVDDGNIIPSDQGKPYAVYEFEAKPRADFDDEIPF
jgi:hypothetical protein